MIEGVYIINTSGKSRLAKFYVKKDANGKDLTEHQQQAIITDVYQQISRRTSSMCNFVEFAGSEGGWGRGSRIVYKNFATLYFVFVVDAGESELGILDMIQTFVETLDKCFSEVCELDLVFNWDKTNMILDEIVMGGMVVETNTHEVLIALKEQKLLEKKADAKAK